MVKRVYPAIIRFTVRPANSLTGQLVATDDQRYFVVLYDPDPTQLEVSGHEVTNGVDTVTQDPYPRYHIEGAKCVSERYEEEI